MRIGLTRDDQVGMTAVMHHHGSQIDMRTLSNRHSAQKGWRPVMRLKIASISSAALRSPPATPDMALLA